MALTFRASPERLGFMLVFRKKFIEGHTRACSLGTVPARFSCTGWCFAREGKMHIDWPKLWPNFQILIGISNREFWANSKILGQPCAFLVEARAIG